MSEQTHGKKRLSAAEVRELVSWSLLVTSFFLLVYIGVKHQVIFDKLARNVGVLATAIGWLATFLGLAVGNAMKKGFKEFDDFIGNPFAQIFIGSVFAATVFALWRLETDPRWLEPRTASVTVTTIMEKGADDTLVRPVGQIVLSFDTLPPSTAIFRAASIGTSEQFNGLPLNAGICVRYVLSSIDTFRFESDPESVKPLEPSNFVKIRIRLKRYHVQFPLSPRDAKMFLSQGGQRIDVSKGVNVLSAGTYQCRLECQGYETRTFSFAVPDTSYDPSLWTLTPTRTVVRFFATRRLDAAKRTVDGTFDIQDQTDGTRKRVRSGEEVTLFVNRRYQVTVEAREQWDLARRLYFLDTILTVNASASPNVFLKVREKTP